MESTITDLLERRSCRSYLDNQITDEELGKILKAGLAAPSAMNRQSAVFVVVQDKKTIAKLSKLNAEVMNSDKDPFYGAPTVIVVLADRNNANAVQDGSLAMGNLMNAAHALGIGSCYIGDIMENYEVHKELLGLPEFVFPALMLVFGYPTAQQKEREKPKRAPLDFIVHENIYPHFSQEEIRQNIADIKGEDFDSWMERFCKRKYQADFSLEMSRSVAAALKNFQQ